ncbi:MAG TPA: LPXTG cell wall anchor domain-containing protein, partial [Actinomycetota bacterium]|nr:LPXTG cell wall anchor domain-containing protein [Actinomycetota bacterium]
RNEVCEVWTLNVDITNGSLATTSPITPTPDNTVTAGSQYTYNSNPGSVTVNATANANHEPATGSDIVTFASEPTETADCVGTADIDFTPTNNDCRTWTVTVNTNGTVTSPAELVDKSEIYQSNPNGTVVSANAPANHSPASSQATVVGLSDSVCSTEVVMTFTENEVQTDCTGDTDPSNNGICNPPPTPDCSGDFDSTNNGPNGDCTIPPLPDCSGDFDPTNNGVNGDCTEPPVDVCPNIEGDQAEVPEGMVINPVTGACEEDQVLGEIINRPKPNKPESVLNAVQPAVLPKQLPAVGALPFTGGNVIPFLMVAGMLMSIGAGVVLRSRRETVRK